jgi:plastocyanin
MACHPTPTVQIAAILLGALVFGLASAAPQARADEGPTVTVGHNRIEPAQVTIEAGGSVTFHNVDAMPGGHTVVADDGSFESPPLEKDQKWSHAFESPGSHRIRIKQHPNATGEIVVK